MTDIYGFQNQSENKLQLRIEQLRSMGKNSFIIVYPEVNLKGLTKNCWELKESSLYRQPLLHMAA